jgi:hypothetical protein
VLEVTGSKSELRYEPLPTDDKMLENSRPDEQPREPSAAVDAAAAAS